jgi:hypothetical protein
MTVALQLGILLDMYPQPTWINELLALASASEVLSEVAPLAVSFETPEGGIAIHFANGSVIESSQADCVVSCRSEVLQRLIRGEETLQVLYLSGDIELKGRPDLLLKLAFIFEQSARL